MSLKFFIARCEKKVFTEANAKELYRFNDQGLQKAGTGGQLTPTAKIRSYGQKLHTVLMCSVLTSAFIICI